MSSRFDLLARSLASWGKRAVKRVQALTRKHGSTISWSYKGAG